MTHCNGKNCTGKSANHSPECPKEHTEITGNNTFYNLLKKVGVEGGCIVSSADCGELEIAAAQTSGDFFVDDNNMGYVRRLPTWLNKHSRFARNAEVTCCERSVPNPSKILEVDIPNNIYLDILSFLPPSEHNAAPSQTHAGHVPITLIIDILKLDKAMAAMLLDIVLACDDDLTVELVYTLTYIKLIAVDI